MNSWSPWMKGHSNLSFSSVDDMDNHKSHIPQSPEIGKTSGSLFKLPSKVTGCIIWSGKYPQNRKVVIYLNHNQFEQSGSKLVTILYKLLHTVIEDFGKLPKHLSINLDNCWRFALVYVLQTAKSLLFYLGKIKTFMFFPSSVPWLNWISCQL